MNRVLIFLIINFIFPFSFCFANGVPFNGDAGDFISIADPPGGELDFGSVTDFSLFLVFETKVRTDARILSKRSGNVRYSYASLTSGFGRFEISDGSTAVLISSNSALDDGQIHSVIVTADRDGNATMYVDCVQQLDIKTISGIGDISNNSNLEFGRQSDGGVRPYNGDLYHVSIFNGLLSLDGINNLCRAQKAHIDKQQLGASLVGSWLLDDAPIGTSINNVSFKDSSENNNPGTGTDNGTDIFIIGEAYSTY